jgi:putative addiction module component (TIGR02574 family)
MTADLNTLPIIEKIQLVEDLWDSIAADQASLPLTPEQRTEIDRLLDSYESDRLEGRVAGKVISDIRKLL